MNFLKKSGLAQGKTSWLSKILVFLGAFIFGGSCFVWASILYLPDGSQLGIYGDSESVLHNNIAPEFDVESPLETCFA